MAYQWLRAFSQTPPGLGRLLLEYLVCVLTMGLVSSLYPSVLAIALAWVSLAVAFWFMIESARFAWLIYLLYRGWTVVTASFGIVALILVLSLAGLQRGVEGIHLATTPLFWAFLGWSVGGLFAVMFERFSDAESPSERI